MELLNVPENPDPHLDELDDIVHGVELAEDGRHTDAVVDRCGERSLTKVDYTDQVDRAPTPRCYDGHGKRRSVCVVKRAQKHCRHDPAQQANKQQN